MTNLPTFHENIDATVVEHLDLGASVHDLKKIVYEKELSLSYRAIPEKLNGFASEAIRGIHNFSSNVVHPIGVYSLGEAGYSGSGHVVVDNKIWASPEILPPHVKRQIESDYFPDIPNSDSPRVKYEGSAIAIMTPGANIYGHLLLDIIPRVWVARMALGDLEVGLKYLVHDDVPAFVFDILQDALGLGEDRIIKIPRNKVIYEFSRLFIPTLIHSHYNFHPRSIGVFSSISRSRFEPKESRKLVFISRSNVVKRRAQFRVLDNPQDVEDLFRSRGYQIITPETLSWREQLEIFSQCDVLAGEYGSALHNSLFANNRTRILSIDCFNDVQSKIASLCGQDIGYVAPAKKVFFEKNRYNFSVDMEVLDQAENAMRTYLR
jgi:hypothetical protein